ncbi:MAG: hypothetical protein CMH22_05635 [Methylophaga sp.]|nr:hypothetical protein [Methylophaga sp.]
MYTNNWYLIASTEEEYDNMSKDCVVKIESFLPSLEKGVYVPSSILEKDQLSFYFIPCLFEWSKSRKERIILNVSNENN